jgi:hypothetical protein
MGADNIRVVTKFFKKERGEFDGAANGDLQAASDHEDPFEEIERLLETIQHHPNLSYGVKRQFLTLCSERLDDVLDAFSESPPTEDLDFRVVLEDGFWLHPYMHPGICVRFGFTTEQIEGKPLTYEVFSERYISLLESLYERCWSGEEIEHVAEDFSGRPFTIVLIPVMEEGSVQYIQGTMRFPLQKCVNRFKNKVVQLTKQAGEKLFSLHAFSFLTYIAADIADNSLLDGSILQTLAGAFRILC